MKLSDIKSWVTYRNDGGRCHVRLELRTACGKSTAAALFYQEQPGKRICKACREAMEKIKEERK